MPKRKPRQPVGIPKPDIRERTRAAVTLLNTGSTEMSQLNAFLGLFHPDMPEETRLQMLRDANRRQR